jgi:hypothetical protein
MRLPIKLMAGFLAETRETRKQNDIFKVLKQKSYQSIKNTIFSKITL